MLGEVLFFKLSEIANFLLGVFLAEVINNLASHYVNIAYWFAGIGGLATFATLVYLLIDGKRSRQREAEKRAEDKKEEAQYREKVEAREERLEQERRDERKAREEKEKEDKVDERVYREKVEAREERLEQERRDEKQAQEKREKEEQVKKINITGVEGEDGYIIIRNLSEFPIYNVVPYVVEGKTRQEDFRMKFNFNEEKDGLEAREKPEGGFLKYGNEWFNEIFPGIWKIKTFYRISGGMGSYPLPCLTFTDKNGNNWHVEGDGVYELNPDNETPLVYAGVNIPPLRGSLDYLLNQE